VGNGGKEKALTAPNFSLALPAKRDGTGRRSVILP